MIYVMSPYSGTPEEMYKRYEDAKEFCAHAAQNGLHVFSPIVHWHEAARQYDLPTDAAFWKGYNDEMQKLCSCGVLLRINGWEKSKGVAKELEYYQEAGKYLYLMKENSLQLSSFAIEDLKEIQSA